MSKRVTEEERIINYFTDETVEKAELMQNIVAGIVRKRSAKTKAKKEKPESIAKAS